MTFGKIIMIYIEIGLALAIIEPVLWKILKPNPLEDLNRELIGKPKAFKRGAMTGLLFSIITGWPVHLVGWYILDPIYMRHKAKKES